MSTNKKIISGNDVDFDDKLRHKALMYVFGKQYPRIVRVDIGSESYYVIREHDANRPGEYEIIEHRFDVLNGIEDQIEEALKALRWIAEGNEFPEKQEEDGSTTAAATPATKAIR